MITVYPYETLGHANHGWLDARHHFSFAMYYNPKRRGFGDLLVINDDKVAAGRGFGTHPHDNMEIITYVREGAITHKDSMGNIGRTEAGDVQVMSAGTGVAHSEMNLEPVDTRLYQIWIEPNQQNVAPRWEARQFPKEPVGSQLAVLASGRSEHKESGALYIHTDSAIYGGNLKSGTVITQSLKHQAYILASKGELEIDGTVIKQGDGAEVTGSTSITIRAITDSEILVIDVPGVNQH
ncbi:MAG: pirin family protein [Alphaproteobacteria bacterium]|nr:pirin family protein [Alphaproteobacteria bacterium]